MRQSVCVAALAVCFGLIAPANPQPAIPDALEDEDFWDLITNLSEPSGYFDDENYVSNELGLERLLPRLEQTIDPGGVYLGVGPEQNFSYIATLRPSIAFVLDIRRQNAMEHLMYKALFEMSEDRADFVSRLFSRPRPAGLDETSTAETIMRAFRVAPKDESLFQSNLMSILDMLVAEHGFDLAGEDKGWISEIFHAFYERGPNIAYVYRDTDEWHPNYVQLMAQIDASGRNWSYLASEESFRRIRRMQLANLVVPIVGDFAGPKALREIGEYVRRHDAAIDVFYVSNVEAYLFESGLADAFYENVASLPVNEASVTVRTFFGSTLRECPGQRPRIRLPRVDSLVDLVADFRNGRIRSPCELVERSR